MRKEDKNRRNYVFRNVVPIYTGLFEKIVRGLTTCHTQYTWNSSSCFLLFNRTTLQDFVTYLTGANVCSVCDSTGLFEKIFGVLTICHTQYTWNSSICVFYVIEQHSKFLLHTLQMLYMCTVCGSTGLFEKFVRVLTTCHTQYTWNSSTCVFFI